MAASESTATGNAPAQASPPSLEEAVHGLSADLLIAAVSDPALSEDLALTVLRRSDLPGAVLEKLGKHGTAMKSRKLKLALVQHPKTPRHVSVPMVRHLFTFDLMKIALTPAVPADVKAAADRALVNRLDTISSGERQSLAHRGSGRIAGALLLDSEPRVIHAALENSRLTESGVIKAIIRMDASAVLVHAVCHHGKWSLRREVRVALLRNQHTPMARALEFARSLPRGLVKEILHGSHLPANIKEYLLKALAN